VHGTLPMPKFLGRDSKSGFFAGLVCLPAAPGARAGVLPVPFFGGWSLRRGHSQRTCPGAQSDTANDADADVLGALVLAGMTPEGTTQLSPA
jgi:hypothetical protein